jgi:hypothetical protein
MKRLRSWSMVIACLGALAVGAPAARAAGAGTVELRIQTASNVAGGALFGIAVPPGFVYNPDSKAWNLNLSAGAGYFVSPMFAIGADLGLTLLHSDDTLTLFTVAPYVKIVTGLAEHETGFFAEPSVGITTLGSSGAGDTGTLLQLGAWLGAHIFVGQSSAFLIGPTISYFRRLSSGTGDNDTFLIGVRFGLSTYLP